jgi:hypothetical protein
MSKPVHLLSREVEEIVNAAAVAVVDAQDSEFREPMVASDELIASD